MHRHTRNILPALAFVPFFSIAATGAMAEPEICTVNMARAAADDGDYSALCGCSRVTKGFVTHLQNRRDFDAILGATAAQCQGLANLLSDLPTASIKTADRGEDRSSDLSSGSGSNGSGSQSDGSDGSSGNNGGTPGDSGSDPGNGGAGPGDGGGNEPGNGGGKGGDGKPGKGGGKGGDGKGGKDGGKGKR